MRKLLIGLAVALLFLFLVPLLVAMHAGGDPGKPSVPDVVNLFYQASVAGMWVALLAGAASWMNRKQEFERLALLVANDVAHLAGLAVAYRVRHYTSRGPNLKMLSMVDRDKRARLSELLTDEHVVQRLFDFYARTEYISGFVESAVAKTGDLSTTMLASMRLNDSTVGQALEQSEKDEIQAKLKEYGHQGNELASAGHSMMLSAVGKLGEPTAENALELRGQSIVNALHKLAGASRHWPAVTRADHTVALLEKLTQIREKECPELKSDRGWPAFLEHLKKCGVRNDPWWQDMLGVPEEYRGAGEEKVVGTVHEDRGWKDRVEVETEPGFETNRVVGREPDESGQSHVEEVRGQKARERHRGIHPAEVADILLGGKTEADHGGADQGFDSRASLVEDGQ